MVEQQIYKGILTMNYRFKHFSIFLFTAILAIGGILGMHGYFLTSEETKELNDLLANSIPLKLGTPICAIFALFNLARVIRGDKTKLQEI